MVIRTRLDDKEDFMRGQDSRYEVMINAWTLAEEKYGIDFYSLPYAKQAKLYAEAEEQQADQCSAYFESIADAAQDR